MLVGGPGTGKTHLATAIGLQAVIHHHRRVRFLSTIEFVNALEQDKLSGKAGRLANRMAHADLVILDELGYLPFSHAGGALLFHFMSKLYERTSLIITTNLSFAEWARRLRRRQAGNGAARPADAPLPHPGDRQRQLPSQAHSTTTKEEKTNKRSRT